MTETTNNRKRRNNREIIESVLNIRDKRGKIGIFKLNLAQQYYWNNKTRRNLILKARQKGLSKVIDADQLIDCVKQPTNAVVISHEKEATKRLFAAVRSFIETAKAVPRTLIDSASVITFPESNSSYFIGTAGQKAFGRGDTVHRAHLSEAAYYPDLEKILSGIGEAAEYGQIDIETTPNGRDMFYSLWQKAKSGLSSYTAIFIPWFIDKEYSVENLTADEIAGLSASVRDMFAMPDEEFIADYTQEEKKFIERVGAEWGIIISPGQIKWRRAKIWDRGEMFWQEYPEDDVSCFLQSGRTVFGQIILDKTKRIPLDNIETWGTDKERTDLKKKLLYGGLDPAVGTLTGDAHSFAVIDVVDNKATVIYELTSNIPINEFCLKVKNICEQFNIWLGVENNGVGQGTIQTLRHLGVRFTEWETNGSNRPVMITDLEEAYRKGELVETYNEAENELRDMLYTENNKAEHPKGKHDDRVFARAIAWQMRKKPMPGVTYL